MPIHVGDIIQVTIGAHLDPTIGMALDLPVGQVILHTLGKLVDGRYENTICIVIQPRDQQPQVAAIKVRNTPGAKAEFVIMDPDKKNWKIVGPEEVFSVEDQENVDLADEIIGGLSRG